MFLKYLLWWPGLLSFKFMWKQTHGKGQSNEKYEFGDFKIWKDRMFLKKKCEDWQHDIKFYHKVKKNICIEAWKRTFML